MSTREATGQPGIWERNGRLQVWYKCSGCQPNGSCNGHTETQPKGSLLRDAKARRAELVSKVAGGGKLVGRKVKVADYAPKWLESQKPNLKPKTIAIYSTGINTWIVPNLGQKYVSELSIDDVAGLIAKMKAEPLKTWSVRAYITPLSRMMSHAVRAGMAASNPVKGLDKSERPKGDQRVMRILSSEEIAKLLSPVPVSGAIRETKGELCAPGLALAPESGPRLDTSLAVGSMPDTQEGIYGGHSKPPLSDDWRPLISFLLFTGLRIGEALNARWEDVDLETGCVTVVASKTLAGTGRSVVLMPALVSILRKHRLRSAYSAPQDYVFANRDGGLGNRNNILKRVLKPALETAGIEQLTLHELRHTFASLLIGMGLDVTYVANQLGHADPAITLRVYSKLYDPARRKDEARDKLQTAFGGLL